MRYKVSVKYEGELKLIHYFQPKTLIATFEIHKLASKTSPFLQQSLPESAHGYNGYRGLLV
jgi:hypothetical protein